jgi:hypothetical protein
MNFDLILFSVCCNKKSQNVVSFWKNIRNVCVNIVVYLDTQ